MFKLSSLLLLFAVSSCTTVYFNSHDYLPHSEIFLSKKHKMLNKNAPIPPVLIRCRDHNLFTLLSVCEKLKTLLGLKGFAQYTGEGEEFLKVEVSTQLIASEDKIWDQYLSGFSYFLLPSRKVKVYKIFFEVEDQKGHSLASESYGFSMVEYKSISHDIFNWLLNQSIRSEDEQIDSQSSHQRNSLQIYARFLKAINQSLTKNEKMPI